MLDAHEKALEHGGSPGVLNLSLVESAIARPYLGYNRSIHSKAAALTQSLANNHGFVDGNKRTTLLVVDLFLQRSHYALEAPALGNEIDEVILAVANSRMPLEQLTEWFRARIVRTRLTG